MTRRERVMEALRHRETDVIPYHIDLTHQEYVRVAEYLKDPDFFGKIGNHLEGAYYDGDPAEEADSPGYFRDDFGVRWNRNGAEKDIGVIDGYVIGAGSRSVYTAHGQGGGSAAALRGVDRQRQRRFKFGMIGFSMFERAWTLRGSGAGSAPSGCCPLPRLLN